MLQLPAKAFYMVRHGESLANQFNLIAGCLWDVDLSEKGVRQAREAATLVNAIPEKPARIFHSPLLRARRTAAMIDEVIGVPMESIDDLKEQHLGDWERKTWAELKDKFLNAEDPPGGESKDVYLQRIVGGLREGLNRATDGIPLFVSHAGSFYGLAMLTNCFKNMAEVKHCNSLYKYEPVEHEGQPTWRITHYSMEEGRVVARAAPFCPTLR